MRCKSNIYLSNTYMCKYISSANTYLLTKFLHLQDILYLPLFSGIGYECRITLAAILFFFFSPTFFFFLITHSWVCLREFGCSQRKGMLRSVSARGNKMCFCWKLLQGKEKDWGGIWSIKTHVSPTPCCEFSSSLQPVLICVLPSFSKIICIYVKHIPTSTSTLLKPLTNELLCKYC